MRVLEIGTGTGYNAALLAELCGDPSCVFSIECQQNVADKAEQFLQEEGYTGIHVICADGYQGVAYGAPFDRIVATVGCSDISPYWLEQLSPDGTMLVPVQHGFKDPLIRLKRNRKDSRCAVGTIVEDAGFMPIQGTLNWANPWRSFTFRGLPKDPAWRRPLPDHLSVVEPRQHPITMRNHWYFHFYLALCSRELWYNNRGYGLADPASSTVVVVTSEGVEAYSATQDAEACERLYERLLSIHQKWAALGCPSLSDYTLSFSPKNQFNVPSTDLMYEWNIERPYFLEMVRLT